MDELALRLGTLGYEFYDYRDPESIGSNVCEFLDTHHAGHATYMRVLRKVLEQNPNSVLKDYVDPQRLSTAITAHGGQIVAKFNDKLYPLREVDFLEMGCNKQ